MIKDLNKEFDSKEGNRAYPHELLLGSLMYYFFNLTAIAYEVN